MVGLVAVVLLAAGAMAAWRGVAMMARGHPASVAGPLGKAGQLSTSLPALMGERESKIEEQLMVSQAAPTSDAAIASTRYGAGNLRDPLQSLLPAEPPPSQPEPIGFPPGFMTNQGAPDVPPPSLSLQGFLWGGGVPKAIINNEVHGVGDTVQGARITAIDHQGVSVEFQAATWRLRPSEGPSRVP